MSHHPLRSRRRAREVDDSDPDITTTTSGSHPLSAAAQVAIDDLSNASRNRMTAHDREPDRRIDALAIEQLRKCNRTGSVEAGAALRNQAKLSAWRSGVAPDPIATQSEDIAGGQYHRERLRREVSLQTAALEEKGVHVDAENFDLNGPGVYAKKVASSARGGATAAAHDRGRTRLTQTQRHAIHGQPAQDTKASDNRPLDPAVDTDRVYKYKGGPAYHRKGTALNREGVSVRSTHRARKASRGGHSVSPGRASVSSRGASTVKDESKGGGLSSRAAAQREGRLWPAANLVDSQTFLQSLHPAPLATQQDTTSDLMQIDKPSTLLCVDNATVAEAARATEVEGQSGPLTGVKVPQQSTNKQGLIANKGGKNRLSDPDSFMSATRSVPKKSGPKPISDSHSQRDVRPEVTKSAPMLVDIGIGHTLRVPDSSGLMPPSPPKRDDHTDGRLTPITLSSFSASPVLEGVVQPLTASGLSSSQVSQAASQPIHKTFSQISSNSLMDDAVPLKTGSILEPEKVALPKFIDGRWYIPAPLGYDPNRDIINKTLVQATNDIDEVETGNPFKDPNLGHNTSEEKRLLTDSEIMVLAQRSSPNWKRPKFYEDLTPEQKAYIKPNLNTPKHVMVPKGGGVLAAINSNLQLKSGKSKVRSNDITEAKDHKGNLSSGPSAETSLATFSLLGDNILNSGSKSGTTHQANKHTSEASSSSIRAKAEVPCLAFSGWLRKDLVDEPENVHVQKDSIPASNLPPATSANTTNPGVRFASPLQGSKPRVQLFKNAHKYRASDTDDSEL